MKTLITATDIAKAAKNDEKVLYVPPENLITPAARDAAKEWGIEILVRPAGSVLPEAAGGTAPGISTAFISQIVGEVLANLNISGAVRQLQKEADPSGLRLVRGDSVILENFPTAGTGNKLKIKELFSSKESPLLSAGLAALDAASYTCDIKQDEVNYILEGAVTIKIQERKYTAGAGDVLFLPEGANITYSTDTKVKWLFVTHPRKN